MVEDHADYGVSAPPCPNKDDDEFYACYNRTVYGPCGDENCGGVCSNYGPCLDSTHGMSEDATS